MDAPNDKKAESPAAQLRRERARKLGLRLGAFVGLPTMVAAAYLAFVATDQYASVSPFMVQSADGGGSVSLESLVGAIPGSSSVKDSLAVREYILSRDVLQRLDSEHAFIEHYKNPKADWLSRLPADATFEETYEYYLDRVHVDYDTLSGVLSLEVVAYAPAKATEFAQAILEYSEKMVNQLSKRARLDAIEFAQGELATAEKRLIAARRAVLEIQNEGADINPEQSASAAMSIRSELQGELAKARAELTEARSFMRPDAPRVIGLQQRVSSLSQQISRENRRLVSPEKEGLNTSVARFEEVMLEKEFAQAMYKSAVSSLELARAEATRQHRYLATIAPPSSPDEPAYPEHGRGVLSAFLISLAVFGIGSLLLAAVREHARI